MTILRDLIEYNPAADYSAAAVAWKGVSVDPDHLYAAYFFGSGYPASKLRPGYNYANFWDGKGAFPSQTRDVALQGAVGASFLTGDQSNYFTAGYTAADIAVAAAAQALADGAPLVNGSPLVKVSFWAVVRLPNVDAYVVDSFATAALPGFFMARDTDGSVRFTVQDGLGTGAAHIKVAQVPAWPNIATKWALVVGRYAANGPSALAMDVRTADGSYGSTTALDGTIPFTSTRTLRYAATLYTSSHLAAKDVAAAGIYLKDIGASGTDTLRGQLKTFFATYGGPPNIVADLG